MTDQFDDQENFTPRTFGEFAQPRTPPKQFKPWHRPRKQFVRQNQWLALLLNLYENRHPRDPLRYLGLPGTDLLDLRYLHEQLCRENHRPLCFLGFNSEARDGSPAQDELNVSLNEVRSLSNVDERSDVLSDDFRLISNKDSIAWDSTHRLGPFDVVNIDLCDGLASDSPQNNGSIYDALAQLMALQSRNSNPWLLLITTRIGYESFDADAEQKLMSHFRENVANCDGFAEACEEILESNVESVDPASCSEADLLNLMIVAIGKWLSKLAQHPAPSLVDLASTQAYRVNPRAVQEDLVSLALRFDPVIEAAANPLSPTSSAPVDECAIAKAILGSSKQRINVDDILEQKPDLLETLTNETAHLLALAHYDPEAYRQWLASRGRAGNR